jgi:hypothetical protein
LGVTQWIYEVPLDTPAHKIRDIVSEYVADQAGDSTLQVMSAQLSLVDPGRLDAAAETLENVNDAMHQLLGEPVKAAISGVGAPPEVAGIVATVAAGVIPLPQDTSGAGTGTEAGIGTGATRSTLGAVVE